MAGCGDGTECDLGSWVSAELEQSRENLGSKSGERDMEKVDIKDTFHLPGRPRTSSVLSSFLSSLTSLPWNA